MIGPFRTLLQTRYHADARAFVRDLAAEFPPYQHHKFVDRSDLVALRAEHQEGCETRTTTELVADGALVWIRIRLYSSDRPMETDFNTALVRRLIRSTCATDAGLRISNDHQSVTSHQQLKNLLAGIRNPERRMPILLMSEPVNKTLLKTAPRLCGIAHVVHIANRLSHRIVEELGSDWPTHGGAIRTFSVPFPGPRSTHPIVLAPNRPNHDVFVRRVRYFAVNVARNYTFPSVDALAAASNAALPA